MDTGIKSRRVYVGMLAVAAERNSGRTERTLRLSPDVLRQRVPYPQHAVRIVADQHIRAGSEAFANIIFAVDGPHIDLQ